MLKKGPLLSTEDVKIVMAKSVEEERQSSD